MRLPDLSTFAPPVVDKQTIRVLVVSFYELLMLKMKHAYKKTNKLGACQQNR